MRLAQCGARLLVQQPCPSGVSRTCSASAAAWWTRGAAGELAATTAERAPGLRHQRACALAQPPGATPVPDAAPPLVPGAAPVCCRCTGARARTCCSCWPQPQHTAPVRPGPTGRFHLYWRERGETSHAWETSSASTSSATGATTSKPGGILSRTAQPARLDNSWRPSLDAMEIMERGGIDRGFIERAIPEFILYWRERGAAPEGMNSKFIQHIRIQWARYSSSPGAQHRTARISDNWQPTEDVYDILRMSHIDLEFARSLLARVHRILARQQPDHTSWNSKFLQHVKYHWAKRHQLDQAGHHHAGQPGSHPTGRTRDRSLADDLTDTSWAE